MKVYHQKSHVSFLVEGEETFSDLSLKVLKKMQTNNMLQPIKIMFNGRDKLLYGTENVVALKSVKEELAEADCLYILRTVLQMISKIMDNGFLTKEAIAVSSDCMYWDKVNRQLYMIVLPLTEEVTFEDDLSWNVRLRNFLIEINNFLSVEKKHALQNHIQYFEGNEKDIATLLMEIIKLCAHDSGEVTDATCVLSRNKKLILHDAREAGEYRFEVNIPEFVIGKKIDGVDGYIGISTSVSRLHCKVIKENQEYYVVDLGSLNHTYVNEVMLEPNHKYKIQDGDVVRLADVMLIAEIREL